MKYILIYFSLLLFAMSIIRDNRSLNELEKDLKTPEQIESYLKFNIYLKEEPPFTDIWQSPSYTVNRKAGDCEDLALLSKYLLEKQGYICYFLAISYYEKNKLIIHGICVFRRKDGYLWFFDNGELRQTKTITIDDFVDYIKPTWWRWTWYEKKGKIIKRKYNMKNRRRY